jgi:hypothetical protein
MPTESNFGTSGRTFLFLRDLLGSSIPPAEHAGIRRNAAFSDVPELAIGCKFKRTSGVGSLAVGLDWLGADVRRDQASGTERPKLL